MKDSILNRKFPYKYFSVVPIIMAVNFLVYLLPRFLGDSVIYYLALHTYGITHGWVWQFVTYMFVHESFSHLFWNMFSLFMFAMMLEKYLGSWEFLLFYFVCGILSGVLCYFLNVLLGLPTAVIGASGVIYALIALASVLFPKARILLFFFIPLRMPVAVLLFIGIEIIDQISATADGIAHLVHLSGIAVSLIYCLVRFRINPIKAWKEAF